MQSFRSLGRSYQWVLCLLWYGFFAVQVPAAYRVILKNGTVLEARSKPINMHGSYEFTASDGQFHAIPLERVDVDGTKAANDSSETATGPKVFTNEDFPSRPPEPDRGLSAQAPEPIDLEGRESPPLSGEAYWREEARELREQIEEADAQMASLAALIEKEVWCGVEWYEECYSLGRFLDVSAEKHGAEHRALGARKKALENEFEQLVERDRKAGALPGWFR